MHRVLQDKRGGFFAVETLVGNAWVEHARTSTADAGRLLATRLLEDPGVRAARVTEHRLVHAILLVHEEHCTAPVRFPAHLAPNNRTTDCPHCGASAQPMGEDAVVTCVVCRECGRVTPV